MRVRTRRPRPSRWTALALVAAAVAAIPAAAELGEAPALSSRLAAHLSQSVVVRYWAAHPGQAPETLEQRFAAARAVRTQAAGTRPAACSSSGGVFNCDQTGLPQNEESVAACPTNANIVLGGTNDYRGLLDRDLNFTGWHLSTDGGQTVANEGLLPAVSLLSERSKVPSGGDPVDFAVAGCDLYAASLAYSPFDPFGEKNGVAVYKSDVRTLTNCPGGSNAACWPTRRLAVESAPGHFLDKEWLFVGPDAVWVTYSDFVIDFAAPLGYTSASIKAIRCDLALASCTAPIDISTVDQDVQFSDVTVGPDGRTYVSWARIDGELPDATQPQTFTIKLRIAPAGSTAFGPERVVAREPLAIPFGGFLHANDFRIATYPKSDVVMVGGHPRVVVVWDACQARIFDSICEEPVIKLTYSSDDGASWAAPIVLSSGGDNYFPTVSADRADPTSTNLAVAWYTSSFDPGFHNRQDVAMTVVNGAAPGAGPVTRLTSASNETEADPLLGGFFIGDYIETVVDAHQAYVHFNANFRQLRLLGQGFAINQQDNFLSKRGL